MVLTSADHTVSFVCLNTAYPSPVFSILGSCWSQGYCWASVNVETKSRRDGKILRISISVEFATARAALYGGGGHYLTDWGKCNPTGQACGPRPRRANPALSPFIRLCGCYRMDRADGDSFSAHAVA
jgi:hypothetical protein